MQELAYASTIRQHHCIGTHAQGLHEGILLKVGGAHSRGDPERISKHRHDMWILRGNRRGVPRDVNADGNRKVHTNFSFEYKLQSY